MVAAVVVETAAAIVAAKTAVRVAAVATAKTINRKKRSYAQYFW